MDAHHLRCFLAVAEELHFGRAAERLHMTPSPVSRTVKELERELQADLFVRRYHAVSLTPAGAALVEPSRDLLQRLAGLVDTARAASTSAPTLVHVGSTHFSPQRATDEILAIVDDAVPHVKLDLVSGMSSELIPAVGVGDLDLAVVHLPIDDRELDSLCIATYSFAVAMRADDPLATREYVTLADLTDRTLITQTPRLQPLAIGRLRRQLESNGVTSFHEMPDTDASLAASYVRRTRELGLRLSSGEPNRVYDDPAFVSVPIRDDGLVFELGLTWRRTALRTDSDIARIVAAARARFGADPIRF